MAVIVMFCKYINIIIRSQIANDIFAVINGYNLKYIEYGKKKACAIKFIVIVFIDMSSVFLVFTVKYTCGNIIKIAIQEPK